MIAKVLESTYRRTRLLLLGLLPLLGAVGCSSIRSDLFTDDGCQDCTKVKKHLHGVPTTLDVPTHVAVYVIRTSYGRVSDKGEVTFVPELESRSVAAESVVQKEVFTVDFKRPAAGSLKYNVKFDTRKQYITKISNTSNDQTITSVANLMAQILRTAPTLGRGGAAGGTDGGQTATQIEDLMPFQEVVVGELFALSEPNVQERIQGFLDLYLNNCDRQCPPCPFPGPPASCGATCGPHGCGARGCGKTQ
jgi:hypothetical protein